MALLLDQQRETREVNGSAAHSGPECGAVDSAMARRGIAAAAPHATYPGEPVVILTLPAHEPIWFVRGASKLSDAREAEISEIRRADPDMAYSVETSDGGLVQGDRTHSRRAPRLRPGWPPARLL